MGPVQPRQVAQHCYEDGSKPEGSSETEQYLAVSHQLEYLPAFRLHIVFEVWT